jgi:hypothetical protein
MRNYGQTEKTKTLGALRDFPTRVKITRDTENPEISSPQKKKYVFPLSAQVLKNDHDRWMPQASR